MAELLHAREWFEPSPLGFFLRETLPDDYFVVAEPTVREVPLDAVVVGPQGLVVLHVRDWEGQIRPAKRGPWRGILASGQEVRHPNPDKDIRQATGALQTFLQDEFPALRPPISHLVVLTSPEASLSTDGGTKPRVVTEETIGEALTAVEMPKDDAFLDRARRENLAVALRDRRLTTSETASEPFVFRSGGTFGSGKKVWTLKAAAEHMDKYPDDGIFHLRNGTLAQWFTEQGADHLAELANEAMHSTETDPRVPLEKFLIESGLVPRPQLIVRPRQLHLGYVLVGDSCSSRLRLRQGKGRGYIFGQLRTSEPWLRAEPKTFSGGPFETRLSADTQTLSISRTSWKTEVLIVSNASEEPLGVPVRVRVVGMPSRLDQKLLRPLVGAILGGLLGAAVGWATGQWALTETGLSLGPGSPAISATAFWALLVGLVWAILGWIRGRLQPLAWPPAYAFGRWLLRALSWAVAFSVLAAVGHWVSREMASSSSVSFSGGSVTSVIPIAIALAALPATAGELRTAQRAEGKPPPGVGRSLRRALLMTAVGVVLALVLVAGGQLLQPTWEQADVSGKVSTSQEWLAERWTGLEEDANDLIDQLTIYYYERQRPSPASPGLVPISTPLPTSPSGEDGNP